jgi:hypothetical protein
MRIMRQSRRAYNFASGFLLYIALLSAAMPTCGQVSPAEIQNPKLKAAEQKYLPQLQSLHKAIAATGFPFAFVMTRYVTVNLDRESSIDSRGLEFVNFQNQVVLKISGIYKAAYNSDQLTENQRASRTFQEVIYPILRLVAQQIPRDIECDAIGFEIVYHKRAPNRNFDFEGKEIVAVVLDRADAFAFPNEDDVQRRQAILNRSAIYVNGKELGLALGERDPLDLDARGRSVAGLSSPAPASPATPADTGARLSVVDSTRSPASSSGVARSDPDEKGSPSAPIAIGVAPPATSANAAPAPADAEHLQSHFQAQLDSLLKEGSEKFHLVDYAPPSFAVYHDKMALQLTFRNPLIFDRNTSSIYKRAAQSFDLFLAPELKGLMQLLPTGAKFDVLDFSVLNRVGAEKNSSEAIEFICPLMSTRSFVDDGITSQDLVNQSIVLVNGVRIALNLQIVE